MNDSRGIISPSLRTHTHISLFHHMKVETIKNRILQRARERGGVERCDLVFAIRDSVIKRIPYYRMTLSFSEIRVDQRYQPFSS